MELAVHKQRLSLSYHLSGDLDALVLPAFGGSYQREEELWRHTCFEAFFGLAGDPAYGELNISPAGGWNLYGFSDYRQGMRVDERLNLLSFVALRESRRYILEVSLPLEGLLLTGQLELGLSVVLEEGSGQLSYWALEHPGSKADFHHRSSFVPLGC